MLRVLGFVVIIASVINFLDTILGYNIILRDSDGSTASFSSNTESLLVSSLQCCSNYSYQVAARTNVGEGMFSPMARFKTNGYFNNGWCSAFCKDSLLMLVFIIRFFYG